MAKVIDCKEGHAVIQITGKDDDELVRNAREHLKQYHPGLESMTKEQILAMATSK